MADKVITITAENACCCAGLSTSHECRSKAGTAAGVVPDAPTDVSDCEGPREGDFSYEIEDYFGAADPSSANYGAPNLPVIKMTASFHVRFFQGPASDDPILSDNGTNLEGGFDTMYELTDVSVTFDDGDVIYTPGTESISLDSSVGPQASVGNPVNGGFPLDGEHVVYGLQNIAASYYDPITNATYYPEGDTRTDIDWPTLCGLRLENGGANTRLVTRLPEIVADTGIAWAGTSCTLSATAPTGNPSTFDYCVVQVRALATGLTSTVAYEVTFVIQKYESEGPMGAGWYDYANVIYSFTASGSTHTGSWVDLVTELAIAGPGIYRVGSVTIAAV
jgi:hypothetical protein